MSGTVSAHRRKFCKVFPAVKLYYHVSNACTWWQDEPQKETSLSSLKDWQVVIPARLHATRLPNKPLVDLGGKPLIVVTAENLKPLVDAGAEILVATDDERIVRACEQHNLQACLTKSHHETGTDRCREAAQLSGKPFILNVQGDEPFLAAADLLALAASFPGSGADMGTLVYATNDLEAARNPNVVKALVRQDHMALYFSRAPVPWHRDHPDQPQSMLVHIGVYAYSQSSLARFCALPTGTLERIEKLEQLRALENGMTIYAHPATQPGHGIDTPADLEIARARM